MIHLCLRIRINLEIRSQLPNNCFPSQKMCLLLSSQHTTRKLGLQRHGFSSRQCSLGPPYMSNSYHLEQVNYERFLSDIPLLCSTPANSRRHTSDAAFPSKSKWDEFFSLGRKISIDATD